IQPTKRFWFERFHWCISSTGNLIIAGKDAKSNEYLVKKYLTSGDRYVHADIHGAPSCIVKQHNISNQPLPITSETLEEACIFAASYSKAWNQYAETRSYWVLPEQVSKTPESGEFVPHGAFIIRGKRNYYRCNLQLAIGKILIDEIEKIMCAPLTAIKSHSSKYLILQPGTIQKNILAKHIASILKISSDIIHPLLPSGTSSLAGSEGYEIPQQVKK
ncbi:MAG: DUF814 domain-containing protein, partial [Candidatus Thermoplasmatota archaeon]|nr:DUF814 domain-containing protein [Candidatus Thermoplasmatota archaeon]